MIMKNHHIAILILTSTLYLFTSAWAADLEDGFMGYKWGDDISHYDGLKQLYNKGEITFYSNPGESYSIEDVVIGDVIYGFYKGKFYAVYINLDSLENLESLEKFDVIEEHLTKKYGPPDSKSSTQERLYTYKWKYKDVTIKLKTDRKKGNMKVAFYHRPTSRELKKEPLLLEIETSDRFFPIEKEKTINMVPFLESWNQR